MLRALYYCHKIAKVIHRDIKPENIMINHNNEAILIDFGISEIIDERNSYVERGSKIYFAPEMI